MTRTTLLALLPLLALPLAGCGPSAAGPAAPALPAPPDTSSWKQIDNPEYQNWKRFPVGTVVVRSATTANTSGDHATTTSVERFKLVAIFDTEATVERQNTTTRSDGSLNKVNDPDTRKVAARLSVHPDLDPADFLKPDRKAKQLGKEKVKVLDQEFECVKWEWANGTEAGQMVVVSWMCDEVPGRVVKQEMRVSAINSLTTESVIEWVKPK